MLADLNDTLSHRGAKHAIETRILTNASTQQQLSNSFIRQTADFRLHATSQDKAMCIKPCHAPDTTHNTHAGRARYATRSKTHIINQHHPYPWTTFYTPLPRDSDATTPFTSQSHTTRCNPRTSSRSTPPPRQRSIARSRKPPPPHAACTHTLHLAVSSHLPSPLRPTKLSYRIPTCQERLAPSYVTKQSIASHRRYYAYECPTAHSRRTGGASPSPHPAQLCARHLLRRLQQRGLLTEKTEVMRPCAASQARELIASAYARTHARRDER